MYIKSARPYFISNTFLVNLLSFNHICRIIFVASECCNKQIPVKADIFTGWSLEKLESVKNIRSQLNYH